MFKKLFILVLIAAGLYTFGDFTVNGVNVRDQLHVWFPPEKLQFWKEKALDAGESAVQAVKTSLSDDSVSSDPKTQDAKPHSDEISPEDQEKLRKLMKALEKK